MGKNHLCRLLTLALALSCAGCANLLWMVVPSPLERHLGLKLKEIRARNLGLLAGPLQRAFPDGSPAADAERIINASGDCTRHRVDQKGNGEVWAYSGAYNQEYRVWTPESRDSARYPEIYASLLRTRYWYSCWVAGGDALRVSYSVDLSGNVFGIRVYAERYES